MNIFLCGFIIGVLIIALGACSLVFSAIIDDFTDSFEETIYATLTFDIMIIFFFSIGWIAGGTL